MKYAIKIKNLSKIYGNNFKALENISLNIEEGDFFAFLGPNGAGKSTTIGILTSLIKKTSGKVLVNDVDIDDDINKAKSFIGVVPQEYNFNIFETPTQILISQAGFYGVNRKEASKNIDYLLKKLKLFEKKDEQVINLSGGMKRRLMIARALIHNPKILLLDEPTAGVDIEIRKEMWDFLSELNKKGLTIILTTHYLEEAENLCKNIAIINKGKIIENTTIKNLIKRSQKQTLILDLENSYKKINNKEIKISKIDDFTIEVIISKNMPINKLIDIFNKEKINIVSIKNKQNRLEELFLEKIKN